MIGNIHSIQSLGTVDGPGVRCVIFMQGCPLRCACCHNPDTWEFSVGSTTDVDTLVKKIVRFKNYFGNKGGVTVSGGEPLCQARFVAELFKSLKKLGINTALDTSGCIWNNDIKELLLYTDLVLLDYKYANSEDYSKYTGCRKEQVDKFLEKINELNIPTWIRRVIIPNINDDIGSTHQLNELADKYSCIKKVELLAFRKLCIEKYKSMGVKFPFEHIPEPSLELMESLNCIIRKTDF